MISVFDFPIEPIYFPDGTFKLELPLELLDFFEKEYSPDPFSQRKQRAISIYWNFESIEEQIILFNLMYHLRVFPGLEEEKFFLRLPYLPNARMDRVKNRQLEVHMLKAFAEFIDLLSFDTVFILDAHSSIAHELFPNAIFSSPEQYIERVIAKTKADVLFFPDKGAYNKYRRISSLEKMYGHKQRDWDTGVLSEDYLLFSDSEISLKGKKILIVDDICSYGGTFNLAVNALAEKEVAEINLFATHCEESVLKGTLIKNPNFNFLYTTDSLFRGEHERIQVIPV